MVGNSTTDSTSARRTPYKRRNYLVNPTFQLRFALTLAIGAFLVTSCMSMGFYGFLHQQARMRLIDPASPSLWSSGSLMLFFALAFSLVMGVTLVVWGILVTHRVSGPLFFLGKCLHELGRGRFPQRRALRKKDEFKELFEVFFATCEDLKARKEAELATVEKLLQKSGSMATDRPKTLEAGLKVIHADLQSLRDELAHALGHEVETPMAEPVRATQASLSGK